MSQDLFEKSPNRFPWRYFISGGGVGLITAFVAHEFQLPHFLVPGIISLSSVSLLLDHYEWYIAFPRHNSCLLEDEALFSNAAQSGLNQSQPFSLIPVIAFAVGGLFIGVASLFALDTYFTFLGNS